MSRSKSERTDIDIKRTPRGEKLEDPRRTPRSEAMDRASSVSIIAPRRTPRPTGDRFEIELRDLHALCTFGLVKREDIMTIWGYFKSGKSNLIVFSKIQITEMNT